MRIAIMGSGGLGGFFGAKLVRGGAADVHFVARGQHHGMPMSSHLMPEVSAHLLSATPTAHWLEYVDWTDAIAADPVKMADGLWTIPDRPGTGLAWDASAVEQYRIQ